MSAGYIPPPGAVLATRDVTARAAPLVVAPIAAVTGLPGRRSAVPLYIYDGDQEFWPPAEGARTRHR